MREHITYKITCVQVVEYIYSLEEKSARKDVGMKKNSRWWKEERRRLTSKYSKERSFYFLISSARTIAIKSQSCHDAKEKVKS